MPARPSPPCPPLAPIERLPKWLLCVPLVAQWLWLALRHRSLTLPSTVNPGIEAGGLVGESKLACLTLIGDGWADRVEPTVAVRPGDDPDVVRRAAGLTFPLIAKPDIGWCGYGVRRIGSAAELAAYGATFPGDAVFLLQRLADGAHEAGLLYMRAPDAAHGRLVALTIRHPPQIVGDGRTDLAGLIAADFRLRRHAGLTDAAGARRIPAVGERIVLTTVASLRVGARYADETARITPALAETVDALARSMGDFHFGRFDVRFVSWAALLDGRFTIIEVNGAGAEAIQCWDPALSLRRAFAGVFAKQRALFALAAAMRRRGHRPIGLAALAAAHRAQQRLMRRYPPSN